MYLAMKEAAALNMALVAHTEDESLLFGGVMHEGEVSKKLGLPGILSAGGDFGRYYTFSRCQIKYAVIKPFRR